MNSNMAIYMVFLHCESFQTAFQVETAFKPRLPLRETKRAKTTSYDL
jgi:hypothetical protein